MAWKVVNTKPGRAMIGLAVIAGLLSAPLPAVLGGRSGKCCCQMADPASSRVKAGCHCRHDRPAGEWLWTRHQWITARTQSRPHYSGPMEPSIVSDHVLDLGRSGPARDPAHGPLRTRGKPLVNHVWRC